MSSLVLVGSFGFNCFFGSQTGCTQTVLSQNQVEPIIQAGHEGMVHHMLLYECPDDITRQHLNYSGECYGPNMPPAITQCAGFSAITSWAIGGKVSKVQHTIDIEMHKRCIAK